MNRDQVLALAARSKPVLPHRYGVTRLARCGPTDRNAAHRFESASGSASASVRGLPGRMLRG